jgi:lipopolysaccharide export system permease protein
VAVRRLKVGGHLDRYVAKLFAMSYLTAFLLVVGLYVVLDLSVNLDEYLQEQPDGTTPALVTVARYYALQLPFLYLEMSPFVTLVAGLFTAARSVRSNEVVAALGAGVSARRLFAPVLLGAIGLAGGMFALREWATDALSRERDFLRERLLEQRSEVVYENLWVRDASGQRLRVEEYRPALKEGRGLLAYFTTNAATVSIDAAVMRDPRREDGRWHWTLDEGFLTHVDAEERRREELRDFDIVDVGPRDFELAERGRKRPLELSFAEAGELRSRDPDNLQYRTVRQYHLTFPLAGLVLLLVGLPFLVGEERGRGVERFAVGVLLCMAYFVVDFVTRTWGINGEIGPLYAAWFPLVLFGSLGLVLFGSMRT